jgi:hypothetical protein
MIDIKASEYTSVYRFTFWKGIVGAKERYHMRILEWRGAFEFFQLAFYPN